MSFPVYALMVVAIAALFMGVVFTIADHGFSGTWWWEPVREMRRERDRAVRKRQHELEAEGFAEWDAKIQASNEVYGKLRNAATMP